jgi:hypothetical protein
MQQWKNSDVSNKLIAVHRNITDINLHRSKAIGFEIGNLYPYTNNRLILLHRVCFAGKQEENSAGAAAYSKPGNERGLGIGLHRS